MRTKKFKDQRLLLKELLVDYNDIAREGYIWGNGSKFNEKLQNELDTVTNEGYVLPSGLNLTSFRQSLYDYLCNDTKAFISKYDFSTRWTTGFYIARIIIMSDMPAQVFPTLIQ